MANKEVAVKKYVVRRSDDERARLLEAATEGRRVAFTPTCERPEPLREAEAKQLISSSTCALTELRFLAHRQLICNA